MIGHYLIDNKIKLLMSNIAKETSNETTKNKHFVKTKTSSGEREGERVFLIRECIKRPYNMLINIHYLN